MPLFVPASPHTRSTNAKNTSPCCDAAVASAAAPHHHSARVPRPRSPRPEDHLALEPRPLASRPHRVVTTASRSPSATAWHPRNTQHQVERGSELTTDTTLSANYDVARALVRVLAAVTTPAAAWQPRCHYGNQAPRALFVAPELRRDVVLAASLIHQAGALLLSEHRRRPSHRAAATSAATPSGVHGPILTFEPSSPRPVSIDAASRAPAPRPRTTAAAPSVSL